ncbi:MAG: FAD-binding oxidoreductase [Candidatus Thorarchaeota archaeon]
MKLREVVIGANASIFYRFDFSKIRGVYYPRTEAEAKEAIAEARSKGLVVTVKGGGSGLSGACTGGNDERIVLSTLRMRRILGVNESEGYVDVEPGVTPDEINEFLAPYGLRFYVAPSSRDVATVGGILNTDGGGNDTWVNGTMRDNTIRARMVLYDGRTIEVTRNGVRSEDAALEQELNRLHMTIDDIASSHGTLGFVTELRLHVRPVSEEEVIGGVAHFDDAAELGQAIGRLVDAKSPIRYGEAIVMAHPDIRGDLRPPLLIMQFPEDDLEAIRELVDVRVLTDSEVEKMKDIRIKLPKRNPVEGVQLALFEGYGLHDTSLERMQEVVAQIDDILVRHGYVPFAKYGHAPSKWYVGNNEPTYGMVMHSREIRPPEQSPKEVLATILEIVDACEELGVTPKPEHKWPYSDMAKKTRLSQLREVLGQGFNNFIFCDDCAEALAKMV